ncbi:MAG: 1-deoxy-D-xylulose-5-phosphate reductoisomerase [Syntrophales bacterium]|jgi:1-deoxy-D-xylulose-5-phosphate reductoisomerase|nr:1-deoxy-D-xylulose-5-phosphate reductoisomerase [Syntrophales bacterium]MCK9528211.1 1-deoxy-D-xylulose-5-phosphate reductoisomerase [Syntrophales bacterium]MDX9921359.1 1-deoxy-D-xylulose-5-phosphate reductoisomerase [Syntrophales bacterium]
MKYISILGSTGSIGRSALDVVAQEPSRFGVTGLAAYRNIRLLKKQIERFQPKVAAVIDEEAAAELRTSLGRRANTAVLFGPDGYDELASLPESDMVLSAMSGAAGLVPTLAAIDAGKDIALANKETMVMAGDLVLARAERTGVRILPVDSEHSALFQCMEGRPRDQITKLVLTASGGPFLNRSADDLASVTPEEALKHPNWDMGYKITIDSATMMNKGLEIIEAMGLFAVDVGMIDVVIHPQSIIHSMITLKDGSLIAQLGIPDMKTPIAYALSWPERIELSLPDLELCAAGPLTFMVPDMEKFRCLALSLDAARRGGTAPAVLNAANEIAVEAFVAGRVRFTDIPRIVEATLADHETERADTVARVLAADGWARIRAKEAIDAL